MGILSLIFWSLIIVVAVKYIRFVMRADNHSEGGILALTALIRPSGTPTGRTRWLILLGLFGAALLYGDGMITPAISVLGAVEGVEVALPTLGPLVVPISCALLIGLFLVQRFGTARVGVTFGPIMLVWFLTLAVAGLTGIARNPHVLASVDPRHAIEFLMTTGVEGFLTLGRSCSWSRGSRRSTPTSATSGSSRSDGDGTSSSSPPSSSTTWARAPF